WLAKRARAVHDVELDMQAAQLLATGIGSRLGVLAQEIDKLVDFVAPAKRIGLEQVRASVGALPQVDRWQWIDKVAERRIDEALAELPDLLDSGESAVGLIGAISESLVRVGLALEGDKVLVQALQRGGTHHNLGWKVKVYVRQARGWTHEWIASALEALFHADRLTKSGGLAAPEALEEALLRIGTLVNADRRSAVASIGGGRG
ncbi:MAG TPA: hypothetical protein VLC48_08570, partial [Gemmatimonadota bacterium]|nr:hypothetical protein [Gemmatimonadota bacterium]